MTATTGGTEMTGTAGTAAASRSSMAALPGPAVARLRLSDFRCYATLDLDLVADPARPVVLTGPNGAGKTNVLEALSFLSPGRGLRRARLVEPARHGGAGGWSVAARLVAADGPVDLGTGIDTAAAAAQARAKGPAGALDADADADADTDGGGDGGDGGADEGERSGADGSRLRRRCRIDGTEASGPAAFDERLCLVWLTPAMDGLFTDAAGVRRRFLDRLVGQVAPGHARALGAYETAQRERQTLLAERGYLGADPGWLRALEGRMAEHGVAVAAARLDAVRRLAATVEAGPETAFPKARLALAGTIEAALAAGAEPAAAADAFRARLKAARAEDARTGRTGCGPQRSDLLVDHAPKAMPARLCSTGEQKALLVGLVLAQARLTAERRGQAPLVLLDEIAAHLDGARRAALFDALRRLGGQVWATGTDRALFAALDGTAQFFEVAEGHILAAG
ncbi:DNA replication/repair protein RecF [Rhodothalassium salexigens]|nr:DNA replication/repair protein RecF [Rhodothalassium salexigens]MBB4211057.1 DNA replication and repair protein RecF [Rhodothalassium salexigens DSM 2132]